MRVLLVVGTLLGLALLVTLLSSSAGDAHDLFDSFGWWGLAIFLAWPIFGIIVTLRDRYR